MDYSNGLFDCQSPTSPGFLGGLRVLHLLEDLRAALELMDNEERDNLRCQIPDSTAEGLAEWLHGRMTNGHSSEAVYQERLSRLESDKECLILQVSVLTDQVEVQGEKIRDLDSCLEQHREKLSAAEELLQQELLNRSALETQKLELMTEVSGLKLKLSAVERDHRDSEGLYQEVTDLRFRVTDTENERLLCEKKLRVTKDEMLMLQRQLDEQELELNKLKEEGRLRADSCSRTEGEERDTEMLKMKRILESLTSANDDKEQRIKELEESLTKCKNVQEIHKERFREDDYADIQDDPSYPVSLEVDQVMVALEGETGRSSGEIKNIEPTKSSSDSFGSKRIRASLGRGFFKLRGGKHSGSTTALETERKGTDHLDLAGVSPQKTVTSSTSPETKKKLKRSHSTSFNLDEAEMEFRRGGVRATAGPRLGWSPEPKHSKAVSVPFSQWSKEEVCAWMQEQGLGLYAAQGQSWIKSGQTLLHASQHDLEKELGIRQPLHRKKLQLALQALGLEEDDLQGRLDHQWVTTIQVLRLNSYEPSCLRRRPSDENNITPADISQWTNHRVMEWLRSVDLAEYAPNLRGSGVHGGLMVFEPRFNVESLALLLNIPPNKTLLRRHLATHFHLLIGSEAQRLKQDCLENPDYTVLTATAKVKPRRLSFGSFGSLRRKRQDDSDEFVCPMNVEMPKSSSFQRSAHLYENHLDHLEQMEDSEGTVRQIGAFSEGINNLTSMLKADEFFQEVVVCPEDTSAETKNS
ncbi:hypothetical protein WMY93_023763 [Mugilogobius chulae]|uniref:SAM domain-containing protein n=1 Tax=Mugilogobius chulae TaxID=88201 RepID=A0AAW0N9L6_9GOBI